MPTLDADADAFADTDAFADAATPMLRRRCCDADAATPMLVADARFSREKSDLLLRRNLCFWVTQPLGHAAGAMTKFGPLTTLSDDDDDAL